MCGPNASTRMSVPECRDRPGTAPGSDRAGGGESTPRRKLDEQARILRKTTRDPSFTRRGAQALQLHCRKRNSGAGEGNRTLVVSLGSFCSTIELHPRQFLSHMTRQLRRQAPPSVAFGFKWHWRAGRLFHVFGPAAHARRGADTAERPEPVCSPDPGATCHRGAGRNQLGVADPEPSRPLRRKYHAPGNQNAANSPSATARSRGSASAERRQIITAPIPASVALALSGMTCRRLSPVPGQTSGRATVSAARLAPGARVRRPGRRRGGRHRRGDAGCGVELVSSFRGRSQGRCRDRPRCHAA